MKEPRPSGPILRRTFGPATTKLRVMSRAEERALERRQRTRHRSSWGVLRMDARLRALGFHRGGQ
jgi:hypothetical protein